MARHQLVYADPASLAELAGALNAVCAAADELGVSAGLVEAAHLQHVVARPRQKRYLPTQCAWSALERDRDRVQRDSGGIGDGLGGSGRGCVEGQGKWEMRGREAREPSGGCRRV
eukprot:362061-Rhodomonas_salina.1